MKRRNSNISSINLCVCMCIYNQDDKKDKILKVKKRSCILTMSA